MEGELCCIVIVILFILLLVNTSSNRQSFSCNAIDGRCYKFSSPQTSPILGELNNFNVKLLRHLRNKYIDTNTNNRYAEHATLLMLRNYNPDNLVENISKGEDDTSYVENKGKLMALCLRDKNQVHALEVLKFVNLHEMSHLAMDRTDNEHLTDFWACFKWLITEATEIGYQPPNLEKNPFNYCGMSAPVSYNPYYDRNLPTYYKSQTII